MKIGVISDTHDQVKNLLRAVKFLNRQKVKQIYHCGDWVAPFTIEFFFNECKPQAPVKGVLGNNEGDRFRIVQRINEHKLPIELDQHVLEDKIDNRTVALYHGQNKAITASLISCGKYDAVFTGHTHIPINQQHGKTLHLNPGTICDAAKSKLIDDPTLALYDTISNSAQIIKFLKEV